MISVIFVSKIDRNKKNTSLKVDEPQFFELNFMKKFIFHQKKMEFINLPYPDDLYYVYIYSG